MVVDGNPCIAHTHEGNADHNNRFDGIQIRFFTFFNQ